MQTMSVRDGYSNLRKIFLASMIIALVSAVVSAQTPPAEKPQPIPVQSVAGKTFTVLDLRKLRWIEGTWRGTGDGGSPFFERYKFENDMTLAVESVAGENLEKVTDVTRFQLQDGKFGGGNEGSLWVASSIDEKSINFEPVVKARNSFRFERISEDVWTATSRTPRLPRSQPVKGFIAWNVGRNDESRVFSAKGKTPLSAGFSVKQSIMSQFKLLVGVLIRGLHHASTASMFPPAPATPSTGRRCHVGVLGTHGGAAVCVLAGSGAFQNKPAQAHHCCQH